MWMALRGLLAPGHALGNGSRVGGRQLGHDRKRSPLFERTASRDRY